MTARRTATGTPMAGCVGAWAGPALGPARAPTARALRRAPRGSARVDVQQIAYT